MPIGRVSVRNEFVHSVGVWIDYLAGRVGCAFS